MSIVETVENVLKSSAEKLAPDSEFRELQEFYEEMQREGIATKQEYHLPPLDTSGQRFQEATTASRTDGKLSENQAEWNGWRK